MFRKTKIQIEGKKIPTAIICSGTFECIPTPETTTTTMEQTNEKQPKNNNRISRLGWALGFVSSVLGIIGGIYSLHELFLSYFSEQKYEVLMMRRR